MYAFCNVNGQSISFLSHLRWAGSYKASKFEALFSRMRKGCAQKYEFELGWIQRETEVDNCVVFSVPTLALD